MSDGSAVATREVAYVDTSVLRLTLVTQLELRELAARVFDSCEGCLDHYLKDEVEAPHLFILDYTTCGKSTSVFYELTRLENKLSHVPMLVLLNSTTYAGDVRQMVGSRVEIRYRPSNEIAEVGAFATSLAIGVRGAQVSSRWD